ncbi:hypothetical protein BV25DRAFT_1841641, partial [Artomyces pyxidatus]
MLILQPLLASTLVLYVWFLIKHIQNTKPTYLYAQRDGQAISLGPAGRTTSLENMRDGKYTIFRRRTVVGLAVIDGPDDTPRRAGNVRLQRGSLRRNDRSIGSDRSQDCVHCIRDLLSRRYSLAAIDMPSSPSLTTITRSTISACVLRASLAILQQQIQHLQMSRRRHEVWLGGRGLIGGALRRPPQRLCTRVRSLIKPSFLNARDGSARRMDRRVGWIRAPDGSGHHMARAWHQGPRAAPHDLRIHQ